MAQTNLQMMAHLRQLIYYHLDNENVDDANFLAARLLALDTRNSDSQHLFALTFLRMRRHKTAYDTAQKFGYSGKHLGCAYVFALACEALGRHHEGVTALEKARPLWSGRSNWNKHSETARKPVPDAPAVYTLLGRLCRGQGDFRRAGDYYLEAHKANPFIWSAFQGLCDTGAALNPTNAFKLTAEMKAAAPSISSASNGREEISPPLQALPSQALDAPTAVSTPTNDPFTTTTKSGNDWSFQFPKLKAKGMFGSPPKPTAHTSWDTPTAIGTAGDDDVEMGGLAGDIHNDGVPAAPARRSKTLSRLGFDSSKDTSRLQPPSMRNLARTNSDTTDNDDLAAASSRTAAVSKRTHNGQPSQPPADMDPAPVRRSNRLFGQIGSSKPVSRPPMDPSNLAASKREMELKKAKATGTKGAVRGTSTVGRVVSGNRKIMPPAPDTKDARATSRTSVHVPPVPAIKPQTEVIVTPDTTSIESLLALFRQLGIGYSALSSYDCKLAIKTFDSVAPAQRETAWVLAQLGKAHHESTDYMKAEQCFARMMKLQPTRVEDTEIYSTVLWHLKKPVQLAFLAHTLKELDFEAPQTWCVVGNAFSLSREPERAISCFRRATQIDPNCAYAWTLMGHELLTNEEFDSAIAAYRKGLGHERRGYSAWYGLGKCYERMGKYEEAERHLRAAAAINKQHSVLLVAIGVVLERMKHPREALSQYTRAIELTPTSTLAHFRKARALMTLRLYNEALAELRELAFLAPEEPNVWFMLGRCHKALGNRGEAVKCFTSSLNLDAKSQAFVKEALDNIDVSDDEDACE